MFKKALLPMLAAAAVLANAMPSNADSMMSGKMAMSGPDHGMPAGTKGGDGPSYTGAPDLQGAISLVVAGGKPGHFSIVKALTVLAGPTTANAEVAKLTKQYGSAAAARSSPCRTTPSTTRSRSRRPPA